MSGSPLNLYLQAQEDFFHEILMKSFSLLSRLTGLIIQVEGIVPFSFFMDGDEILGAIQIRHHIDHPNLRDSGGHIGYGLRPSARGKGYAKNMLKIGLDEARKMGLKRVLLSADDDNPTSWKTIEANGGVFERMTEKNGKLLRIYWISL